MSTFEPTQIDVPQMVWDIARAAGLAPQMVTPALCRALMQWSGVLAQPDIVAALRHARTSTHILTAFRDSATAALKRGHVPKPTQRSAPASGGLSDTDRRALRAQFQLESLTDAEYQDELVRRLAQT